jgi:hypothetical protein
MTQLSTARSGATDVGRNFQRTGTAALAAMAIALAAVVAIMGLGSEPQATNPATRTGWAEAEFLRINTTGLPPSTPAISGSATKGVDPFQYWNIDAFEHHPVPYSELARGPR